MSFSIRLSAEEKSLAESYAKLHALSVGEAFKRALFERIEDEYVDYPQRKRALPKAMQNFMRCPWAKHSRERFLKELKMNTILLWQRKPIQSMSTMEERAVRYLSFGRNSIYDIHNIYDSKV